MKRKICVIIGHGGKDYGAINPDTKDTELKYNTYIANKLEDLLLEKGYNVKVYSRGHAKVEDVTYLNNFKFDLFISLHCNSFNRVASGTEMLYWNKSNKSKRLAEIMQSEVVNTLGLTNRGTKPKKMGDRGAYLLKKTNAPCIICEPFFIDNNNDLEVGFYKKDEYVKALFIGIDKYFNL